MIQFNPSTGETKIVESKEEALTRLTGKRNAQHAFNDLLWDIIKNNGGSVSIPVGDLRRVPPDAKLIAHFNGKVLTVQAGIQKGKIITPPNAGRIVPV